MQVLLLCIYLLSLYSALEHQAQVGEYLQDVPDKARAQQQYNKGHISLSMLHEINAKARATQMVKKGKLSPSAAAKIKAKANKVLGK